MASLFLFLKWHILEVSYKLQWNGVLRMSKWFTIVLVFLSVFSVSCQKYSKFQKVTERRMALSDNDTHIKEASDMPWHVGNDRDITISKGIQVKISFPALEREDLAYLAKIQGINAWVVRVSRTTPTRPAEVLGMFYVPLLVPRGRKQLTSVFRAKQIENAFFNVYYSAAAISKRFENSHCPVFNHSKYLEDVKIVREAATTSTIAINTAERESFSQKVEKFGYRPIVFNGGGSVKGRYVVDIALYNFKTKMKQSSFIRLPETVDVSFEGTKVINECEDYKMPKPKPGFDNPIERFRWQRQKGFLD